MIYFDRVEVVNILDPARGKGSLIVLSAGLGGSGGGGLQVGM